MSALIAVLVAAFLLHWFYLYDKGGVFIGNCCAGSCSSCCLAH